MSKVTTILSKVIGAGAMGAILYNAHSYGRYLGEEEQKINMTAGLSDAFVQSNRLETFNPLTLKLKQYIFKKELDETGRDEMQSGLIGYFEGFAKGLVDNIVPLALATGSLMYNKFGKVCTLGLLLAGLKYWRWDIVGHGKAGYLDEH